jgi:3-oxoadipate enol-lactonase
MIRHSSPVGYSGCCHAIAALDLTDRIHALKVAAIVVVGEEDQGTPVAMSRTIHERISGSELVIIPSASHLSNMEQADAFNQAITSFLKRVT